jgi:hypothetical protein
MPQAADIICAALSPGLKAGSAEKRTAEVLAALEAAGFSILPRDADSAMPIALLDVAAERRRQVEAEGWTAERDDTYQDGALAMAGAAYALSAAGPGGQSPDAAHARRHGLRNRRYRAGAPGVALELVTHLVEAIRRAPRPGEGLRADGRGNRAARPRPGEGVTRSRLRRPGHSREGSYQDHARRARSIPRRRCR